jgi:hypothetical protein
MGLTHLRKLCDSAGIKGGSANLQAIVTKLKSFLIGGLSAVPTGPTATKPGALDLSVAA